MQHPCEYSIQHCGQCNEWISPTEKTANSDLINCVQGFVTRWVDYKASRNRVQTILIARRFFTLMLF